MKHNPKPRKQRSNGLTRTALVATTRGGVTKVDAEVLLSQPNVQRGIRATARLAQKPEGK